MPEGDPPSLMSRAAFIDRFGHVFESSAWIAAAAFDAGLDQTSDTAAGLHARLCDVFRDADPERRLAVLQAHPDLAGRLARDGKLTADSTAEQSGAGLDHLSAAERERFEALNERYRERFGIPFIMAIKGRSKDDILMAFERRLANDAAAERMTAMAEVERIALLRLQALLP